MTPESDDQLGFDFDTISRSMPRERRQNGWVEKTGRKTKTWTGFWYEYVRQPDGSEKRQQRSKVLGKCVDLTQGAAEDELRDVIRAERPPAKTATFAQLARWYLKTNKGRWSAHWYASVSALFTHQILPRLGDRVAAELKRSEIQQAINDIAADPKSQSRSQVEKALTHIRAVFNSALDDEFLDHAPVIGKGKIILPPTRRPSERFLTLEEAQQLLDVAGARDRLILRLFVVCGFRPAELFALRVNDVLDGALRIDETAVPGQAVKGEAKTEASRGNVPVSPELHAELLAYIGNEELAPTDFLFPSAVGTAMSHDNYLDRTLKRLGVLAGIDVVRNSQGEVVSSKLNHQVLRRTTATHFQKHGGVKDAQALLRHTNASTTLKHYQKTLEDSVVAGVAGWDAELRTRPPEKMPPGRAGKSAVTPLRRVK